MIVRSLCRQISIGKELQCYRCRKFGHKVNNCNREAFNEKDLISLFAEQKKMCHSQVLILIKLTSRLISKRLAQLMNNIETKFNDVLTRH